VGNVFNLGNPVEVTIEELARRVIAITGANVEIDYVPYVKAYEAGFEDMERRMPDIAKVVEATGYSPTVSLNQALANTRDWFLEDGRLESMMAATSIAGA
jgi:UDP-glucose 4-epimerase